ncbi:MAG: dephospho-CoA kinase [Acidimicrobiales bacterium]
MDADEIVKRLQAPGGSVLAKMVERWGTGIVDEAGVLLRQKVADIVFSDPDELKAIEEIVHPEVGREMMRQMIEAAPSDRVVILDIPLLAEGARKNGGVVDRRGASGTIVVDCPPDVAVSRLVTYRNFDVDDARRRIEAQVSRDERLALADFVVENGGDLASLKGEIDRCWAWLVSLPPTDWSPPERDS